MIFFKGILYKNNFFYNLLDFIKNKQKRKIRFKILNKYIKNNSSLIDICGGGGWLKDHIFKNISYTVADASVEFGNTCKKKKINFVKLNCENFNIKNKKYDYSVMIISLYQFKKNFIKIFKNFKKITKRKIIFIEEISPINEINKLGNLKKIIRGYLCKTDFYKKNNDLYSYREFNDLMKKYKFKLISKYKEHNLLVGIYKIKQKIKYKN